VAHRFTRQQTYLTGCIEQTQPALCQRRVAAVDIQPANTQPTNCSTPPRQQCSAYRAPSRRSIGTTWECGDDIRSDSPVPRPHAITKPTDIPVTHRNSVIRWMIGAVCQHQQCLRCGSALSRLHGEECSGARQLLTDKYASIIDGNSRATVISQLINSCRDASRLAREFISDIADAIGAVFQHCRGMQQMANGYWKPIHQDRQQPFTRSAPLHHCSPITGGSRNPALRQRRAIIALQRNRRPGRPSKWDRGRTGIG